MNKSIHFKNTVKNLEDHIALLCDSIVDMDNAKSSIIEIEALQKETEAPEEISVIKVSDGQIPDLFKLQLILGGFYSDHKVKEASTKITKKYAGIITIPEKQKTLIENRVALINSAKRECKKIYESLASNKETRFQIAHEILPQIVNMQIFREIQVIPQKIESISFYWRNTMVSKRYTRDQVIDFILEKRETLKAKRYLFTKNKSIWEKADSYIETILLMDKNAKFRIARTSSIPTPASNIKINDNGTEKRINKRASIPYICFNEPKKINFIDDYINSGKRNKDTQKYQTIIKEINLEMSVY